MENVVLYLVS